MSARLFSASRAIAQARPVLARISASPRMSVMAQRTAFTRFHHTTTVGSITYGPSSAFVSKPAPQFTAPAVVDGEIKDISLSDYKGKYTVLLFYPKDFTYVCPTEIIAFSDRAAEFRELGAEVLAISTDTEESHLAWNRTKRSQGGLGKMDIPLVSDNLKTISNDYGVLIPEAGIALRGLFIIDPEGVLKQATINNLDIGRSVDETKRLIQALQFVAEHGEVCPANWKPGDKTMKGDPEQSHEYFSETWAEEDTTLAKTPEDAPKNLRFLQSSENAEDALKEGKVVLMLGASWCGKCEQITPHFIQLARDHPNLKFVKIDVNDPAFEKYTGKFGVSVLPGFVTLENGSAKGDVVTGYKKQRLTEAVKAFAK